MFNVTVQLSTPRWVVGRALALYQTATFGGMALGAWIWGLSPRRYGTDVALLVAAGAAALRRGDRLRAAAAGADAPTISTRSTAGRCRTSRSTCAAAAARSPS